METAQVAQLSPLQSPGVILSRRSFIGSCALLAAAPLVAAESRIKVGFLGLAHSHALGKYRAIQVQDAYEIIGAAEPDEKVRQQFAPLSPSFLSTEELLQRASLVVVESPVRHLAAHALRALRAGRHVHVEKPPADNLADVQEMTRLAREKKLAFQTGYMWRYHPGCQKIFEAARAGWLGDIYLVRVTMNTHLASDRRGEWAQFKGGGMFELGSHLVDFLVRLLGKPGKVHSVLRTHGHTDDLKDNNLAIFEYPKTLALVTNNTLQPNAFAHRSIEVCGTNGTAMMNPIEPPTLDLDLAKAAGPYTAGRNKISLPQHERYVGDFIELAQVISGKARPAVTLQEEVLVQEVLLEVCGMN